MATAAAADEAMHIEKPYLFGERLNKSKDSESQNMKDYRGFTNAAKMSLKYRQLAAQLIQRVLDFFPEFSSSSPAIDIHLDLSERQAEQQLGVRVQASGGHPLFLKDTREYILKIVRFLVQSLQADEFVERDAARKALMALLWSLDVKASFTALVKHIGSVDDPSQDDVICEKFLSFIRDKVFPIKAEVLKLQEQMERHIIDLIKKILEDVTGAEFRMFMDFLKGLNIFGEKALKECMVELIGTVEGQADLDAQFNVEISEHISTLDISELQCKLKDIYFPYIQTDLAHNSPFTTALRNFGNENEKDMIVQIDRDGTLLDHSQLKRDYENWILQMHDQYDDEDQPGGFVGAAPRIMKTIGTTNVLYHTKEEFFAGADTRETFETASNMYIVTDKCIKCQEFKKSIFVTFNGDVPIGREILSHLKRKLDLQKNKNRTVTVSQLAEEAYNCNTIFEGECTVYIGGLQEGAPALHVLKVNINRESGTLDKRLERQKLTKSQELLVDGHGGPVAEKIWEEHKGYLRYTSGQIRILFIQSLVSSALVSKATGGSLSYCHFYTIGGVPDATVETRTVKAWYEAVYDSFQINWHDRNVFLFFDKNKLHDDYFARWIRQLGVKGSKYLNIGSTIGKVHRKKDLFFVQGETTSALRRAILAQGVENTKVFPKLKSHMGIQGLREYNFEGETFYVAGSSQGLLENMQLDLNIDESNIIPGPARLHAKYIENPL